jgi:hypothetical protein
MAEDPQEPIADGDERNAESMDLPLIDSGEASRNSKANTSPVSAGERISNFLDLIKPYRELLTLLVGVVVAISATTAWVTSYFATRAQVSHLECRTSDYIHAATKPLQSDLGRMTAKWDREEARRLVEEGDPKQNAGAARLLSEADTIEAEQDKEDTESDKKFVDATAKCDRGSQTESALTK